MLFFFFLLFHLHKWFVGPAGDGDVSSPAKARWFHSLLCSFSVGKATGTPGSPSDAEVGAALLVGSPALLRLVPAARLVLPAGVFPLPVATPFLPEPSLG